jgi:hypothetical protein
MSYIDPSKEITDGVPHDKAPYDRSKLKPSYEELERELERVCMEAAKQAYDNWMLRLELAKCKKA